MAKTCPILPMTALGLAYAVGGRRLVDGVTLTLEAGRRTVILGPNGAGKSVLLRLLHGLTRPTAGSVTWAGRRADASVYARQAMVFQRPIVLRRSTAANLRFALKVRGVRGADLARRTDLWLERAGLTHLAQRPARVLSGGERQRLAIARAMAREPEILFLDEPTANLDPASTLAVETLIGAAHEAGTKIVLVTHDLGQARRLADEIVFLCHGRIEEITPADRFFEAPVTERARDMLDGKIVL